MREHLAVSERDVWWFVRVLGNDMTAHAAPRLTAPDPVAVRTRCGLDLGWCAVFITMPVELPVCTACARAVRGGE